MARLNYQPGSIVLTLVLEQLLVVIGAWPIGRRVARSGTRLEKVTSEPGGKETDAEQVDNRTRAIPPP